MSSQLWQVTVRNHQLRLDLTISHRGHHYSPDITNEIITRLIRGYVELIDFHETSEYITAEVDIDDLDIVTEIQDNPHPPLYIPPLDEDDDGSAGHPVYN